MVLPSLPKKVETWTKYDGFARSSRSWKQRRCGFCFGRRRQGTLGLGAFQAGDQNKHMSCDVFSQLLLMALGKCFLDTALLVANIWFRFAANEWPQHVKHIVI